MQEIQPQGTGTGIIGMLCIRNRGQTHKKYKTNLSNYPVGIRSSILNTKFENIEVETKVYKLAKQRMGSRKKIQNAENEEKKNNNS